MIKTPLYTYLGTNGTLTTPIHLEGIYSVLKYRLEAEANKYLSKDNGITTYKIVTVPASEVDEWKEVRLKVTSE